MQQLDPVFSIVKNQLFLEEQRRWSKFAGRDIRAVLGAVLPAAGLACIIAVLVFFHFFDHADAGDRGGAVLDPDAVAVGMVPVVMRIEDKTNRLVGNGLDFRNNVLRPRGKIAVDDQHVIVENNPAIIAMSATLEIALVEINPRGDIRHLVDLCPAKSSRDDNGQDN